MNLPDIFTKFVAVLNKIVVLVGGDNQTKTDLLDSVYLNLTAILGEDPVIKPLIGNTSDEPLTLEQFESRVSELQTRMQANDFDFSENFQKAIKQTLNDYATEIEPTLDPEKLSELKRIISEEI